MFHAYDGTLNGLLCLIAMGPVSLVPSQLYDTYSVVQYLHLIMQNPGNIQTAGPTLLIYWGKKHTQLAPGFILCLLRLNHMLFRSLVGLPLLKSSHGGSIFGTVFVDCKGGGCLLIWCVCVLPEQSSAHCV